MNNRVIGFLIILITALLTAAGCLKQESYPNTPQIEFVNYINVFDTGQYAVKGILTISFRDGDGNIGLNSFDTFPPFNKEGEYYYNYVITYFEKQNGVFTKIDLEPPFSARIPVLTPLEPNKAIKGVIVDTLGPLNPFPLFDTIKFEAFIYDRTLNKSNVISTPEIILRRP